MGKIDITKDFSKVTGSLLKAEKIVRTLLDEGESLDHTRGMQGNRIVYARGKQNKFKWSYNPDYKSLSVEYTDGREKPVEEEKPEYYVVWIEGLDPFKGEKIEKLLPDHTYTTKMTRALRVLPEHRGVVKSILRERGIAKWALQNCMVRTTYAPRGTLFKP